VLFPCWENRWSDGVGRAPGVGCWWSGLAITATCYREKHFRINFSGFLNAKFRCTVLYRAFWDLVRASIRCWSPATRLEYGLHVASRGRIAEPRIESSYFAGRSGICSPKDVAAVFSCWRAVWLIPGARVYNTPVLPIRHHRTVPWARCCSFG
jgi:hypothetical protein